MLARKEREFNDSLAKSRGVIVDALSNTEIVTPGESVDVTTNVFIGRPSPGENGSNAASPKILVAPAGWRVEQVQAEEERPTGVQAFIRGRERPMLSLVSAPRSPTTNNRHNRTG